MSNPVIIHMRNIGLTDEQIVAECIKALAELTKNKTIRLQEFVLVDDIK